MKDYIKLSHIIHCEGGADEAKVNEFIDAFCELVENFGWTCGGMFHPMTEAEMEKHDDE